MALTETNIDLFLSTVDQLSPANDSPAGRLGDMTNAIVRKYVNPRAADGTVTHVRAEKRPGFTSLTTSTEDASGASVASPQGTPQLFFGGGGDALRKIVDNRLYTKTKTWVKDSTQDAGDSAIFPHVLRSTPLYAAPSQAEAQTLAVIGDVYCTVWREVAVTRPNNDPSIVAVPAVNTQLDGVRVQFATLDGVIRPAFTLDPVGGNQSYAKVRVFASDGVFWVLQDYGPSPLGTFNVTIWATVFDTSGVQLAAGTLFGASSNESWDATVINTDGVVVAQPNNGSGVKFAALTWDGAAINQTYNTDTSIKCAGKYCAWLSDATNAANVGYLATVHNGGTDASSQIWAYRITSLAKDHEYPAVSPTIDQTRDGAGAHLISGITGYHVPSSNTLVVAYSLMNYYGDGDDTTYGSGHPDGTNNSASSHFPDQLDNTVYTYSVPFTGSSTLITSRFSMSLASRAFQIGDDWVAIGYYPGRKFGPLTTSAATTPHYPQRASDPSNFQPCWYVLPLALKQPMAGRFEYGLATADYQVLAYSVVFGYVERSERNRCLTSVVTLSDGSIALPLGYRAEQNIPSTDLFWGTPQNGQPIGTLGVVSAYQTNNTVGVKLFRIGPDFGQAFTVGQATFLPGLMTAVVEPGDVQATEHGLTGPECPRVVLSATTATSSFETLYYYRACFEWTSSTGRLYRSIPSAAFAYKSLTADHLALAISGHTCAQSNKKGIKASLYRTGTVTAQVVGSAQITSPPTNATSTSLTGTTVGTYKITDDLRPLYSDPTATTWTFTDWMGDSTQGSGELLYTDQGFLPRYPAPASRGGCVWQNRAWLIGYDNSLWFSGEITEGEGEWFNPGFRVVVPTNAEITSIAPMDQFLLVFTTDGIWYLREGDNLPDNTGNNGSLPTPIRLPFEMGGTGLTAVLRQGCVYSSTAGGLWLITRDHQNVWIGQQAQDYFQYGVTSLAVSGSMLVAGNGYYLTVYDINLGGWGMWTFASSPVLVTNYRGLPAFADINMAWIQAPGTFKDIESNTATSTYVSTSVQVNPNNFGSTEGVKRIWQVNLKGDVLDACSLTYTLEYETTPGVDFGSYTPVDVSFGPLEQEIRPTKQLVTTLGVTVFDEANADTNSGAGFALECISVVAGVEKGLKKKAASSRARAT